jgi:RNA polymerase sigma-70 factor (ECF subfamily)
MFSQHEHRESLGREVGPEDASSRRRALSMRQEQPAADAETPVPDPAAWVDRHGNYLFRYAVLRLRDGTAAEDIVQETLLSALQSYRNFQGRGSERTWLTGILKHKIIDHFRRVSRETPVSQMVEESFDHEELFRTEGQWEDHFDPERAPVDWRADPAELLRESEFWEVFGRCLSPLPARIASAFTLREVDGHTSEEICEILSITASNLWVMLYRARTHLRRCLELNWFRHEPGRG